MRFLPLVVWLSLVAGSALAAETTSFTYDALGRLKNSTVSGGPANGVQSTTSFDPAGNRTNVTVTGASSGTPSFSISSVTVTERGAAVFTVTRSGTPGGTLTVNYATANGTALSGSDYTAASGTLTFLVTDTSKTISVGTINDTAAEPTETFTVTLSSPSGGAILGTAVGTATILDNDAPPPSFAISDAAAVTEGGTLVFTVTKTGSTTSSYSVNYATASGTATSGSDFTPASGTLTFAAAESSKIVNVITIDNTATESAETVLVNLSAATGGATIADSQGVGTINDNDGVITLTDYNLTVLAGHTSTYNCVWLYLPEWGLNLRYCSLNSNGFAVFIDDWGNQTFDPGYSMTANYVLQVTSAAYGTGTSP